MKNFRKVHYGLLIAAFCCSLFIFAAQAAQGKFDGAHLTLMFWIAYVIGLEAQSDRNTRKIEELRSEIDKIIKNQIN